MKTCPVKPSTIGTIIAGAALLLSALPAPAQDYNVGQLWYANCGNYVVTPLWLNWKVDGEKYSKELNRSLAKGDYTCVDLGSYDVPEGAEVWLSFLIVAGEKESCRKDNKKFFFQEGNQMVQFLNSQGTTFNDNRCRLNERSNPEGSKCESKGDAESWWSAVDC